MTIKNEVLIRVYTVLALIVIAAAFIFFQAFKISVTEGKKWRAKGDKDYRQLRVVEGDRGNILAHDGSFLATSLPFFDLGFDPNSTAMSKKDFEENIDSLAYCIATFLNDKWTPGVWRDTLVAMRAAGREFIPIKKDATLTEKLMADSFPLFNMGQFKGGFIAKRKYKRERPFNILAFRTVGYVRENEIDTTRVGLEGSYDHVLKGGQEKVLMYKVSGGHWKPVEDLTKIDPAPGLDLISTLDINIQDIAENELLKAMAKHRPKYGVAIVMEVETGAIRAIANVEKYIDGKGQTKYWESYNHAIGTATEPGSTYKLASMMALLEDEYVDLDDLIELDSGRMDVYEEVMEDASYHLLDTTTVRNAFEISSNVGIAKMVMKHYGGSERKENRFIEHLKAFHLHLPTGIEIKGEDAPYLKTPRSVEDQWSGTTLPWMSIGYETEITPLQLLTFFNAVANDGKMMKPYLVTEFQNYGETVEKFPAKQIGRRRIASKETIKKAQALLEGVVERGTAKKYKSDKYRFAGKTGTAQVNYKKIKNETVAEGHQASFAGYFPADNPKYSCIILINDPKEGGYYGSSVALPVFKGIADRIMATKVDLYQPINGAAKPVLAKNKLPDYNVGHRQDMQTVLSYLDLPFENRTANKWAVIRATETDSLKLYKRSIHKDKVPNVVGMGLRDAVYILENLGLQVEINGYGKIVNQSIKPGTKVHGQKIKLRLG